VETDQTLVPSVVAVLVVHQPGEWFDETLRSLAAQDYTSLRTLFLLTPAPEHDRADLTARIRDVLPAAFIRELPANLGFGPSANEVLRLVEGDNGFFLICHDDVVLDPRAVRLLVNELFRSNAGIVGPKLVDWERPRTLQHVGLGLDRFGEVDPLVEPGEVDQEQHDAVRDVFVLPSACLLIRADLMRALGGFDPTMSFHGEDIDLCWRAHLTGARVVVAPDARVRHRERLIERRPDLNHRTLMSRHRMRSVATLTGGSRLFGRSVQLVLLTLVEVIVGLFTGRLGEALASLRALIGLVPRTPSIMTRRRNIRGQRAVPEREVLGLQDRGSSRLTSYLRGKDTATFVGSDATVRRWRETSFGPFLTWFCLILAVVIGSRSFIRHGVPEVGEFLPFPTSPRQWLSDYRSGFDSRSFGSTTPVPTGWAVGALLSAVALFRMPLFMTFSVVGLTLVAAFGAWRLATVFPSNRARIATTVAYVAVPLVPGMLGQGDMSALVWLAACPWLLHLVRRAAGIATADPSAADLDLADGIAPVAVRHRIRAIAFGSLVLAAAAAFVPVVVVLFAAAGLLLALATLLAGGAWRVAAWLTVATLAISVIGVMLNLPWALEWTWADLVGPTPSGASGLPLWRVATLGPMSVTFSVLALGLYVPVVAALAITRAWRLTWAARGAALVIGFGAALVVADRHIVDVALPRPSLLGVPIALGMALGGGALAGGFGTDVMARGFGWRQPAAVLANMALVVGLVPGVLSIGDGRWGTPGTPLTTFLTAQLPVEQATGDYRVLYVGDGRLLPVPGHALGDGIAYAVVDAGPLDFTDRFHVDETAGDAAVERALRLIASSSTLRVGRLLAPLGVRYVIIPKTDGVHSTADDPIAVPAGLLAALENQLDLGSVPGPPAIEVFSNQAWFPVGAQLSGATAEASKLAGEDSIVRADLSSAVPSMFGIDAEPSATNEVAAGVVHLAIPFDRRLTLTVAGGHVDPRPGFGVTTAFDVPSRAVGTVSYRQDGSRSLWLAVQAVLWFAVLVAAAGTRAPFSRRRTVDVHDETLIDLTGDLSIAVGVAGEALAGPGWGADDDDADDNDVADDDDDGGVSAGVGLDDAGSDRRSPVRPVIDDPHGDRGMRSPVRDTTPPAGIQRPVVAGTAPDDAVDLAALVATVDEAGGDNGNATSEPDSADSSPSDADEPSS
jgi:GT2 family glycosyltransferase